MNGKWKLLLAIILVLLNTSCNNFEKNNNLAGAPETSKTYNKPIAAKKADVNQQKQEQSLSTKSIPYTLVEKIYIDKDVTIKYPQINGLDDKNKQVKINHLLKSEAFVPFNHFYDGTAGDLAMEIEYKVEWESRNLLSVQYIGGSYAKGAAHPNNFFYTINIDMNQGKKLKLNDIVHISEEFINKLKEQVQNSDDEWVRGLRTYADEWVPEGFIGADTSFEISEKFTYFTADSLGFSISVSHSGGDHIEFEIKYQDIKEFLNIENETWKEFEELSE